MSDPRRTTAQRGYNYQHKKLRKSYEYLVRSGNAVCWRCGRPIPRDADFDLGHDDHDRTKYRGPEHISCNRATKGRHRRPVIGDGGPTADTSRRW